MSTYFRIEHRTDTDGIAVLTFDRPDSRANILDRPVWDDLHRALKSLRVRPGVTGLVLASAKPWRHRRSLRTKEGQPECRMPCIRCAPPWLLSAF